jgi:hypothetical protein
MRTGLVGGLLVSVVFVTLFLLAAMQAVLVQGQLRLDRLQGDLARREQDRDGLDLQVNTLESPDRLAQAATALGMVPAPQVLFLYGDPAAAGEPPRGPAATPDTLAPTRPSAAAPDAPAPAAPTPAAPAATVAAPGPAPTGTVEPGGDGVAPPQPVAQG